MTVVFQVQKNQISFYSEEFEYQFKCSTTINAINHITYAGIETKILYKY